MWCNNIIYNIYIKCDTVDLVNLSSVNRKFRKCYNDYFHLIFHNSKHKIYITPWNICYIPIKPDYIRYDDIIQINDCIKKICKHGSISLLKRCMKFGMCKLNTYLYLVCKCGHDSVVNYIVNYIETHKKKYNIHKNNIWYDGLVGACLGGHLDIVKWMIILCNDISEVYRILEGIFYEICKSRHLNIIRFVINIAKPNFNYGLHAACVIGDYELMYEMVNRGANDWEYSSELACEGGNINIVKYLFKRKCKITCSTFRSACKGGNRNIISLIISYGVTDWNSGLKGACEGNHIEIVKWMIDLKANIELCAYYSGLRGNREIIELFMKLGIKNYKHCILGTAYKFNKRHMNLLRWLIETKKINNGYLFYICASGDYSLINTVLNIEDLNAGLAGACKSGHLSIAKWLVELGAVISKKLLYTACANGYFKLLKYLLTFDTGIDIKKLHTVAKDNYCWKIMHYLDKYL